MIECAESPEDIPDVQAAAHCDDKLLYALMLKRLGSRNSMVCMV
jgi:hypothetical protein